MIRKHIKHLILALLLTVGLVPPLSSCQPENPGSEPARFQEKKPCLLNAKLIGEFTKDQIAGRFSRIPQTALLTSYAVKAYRLEYRTTNTNGEEIKASGAILVPVTDQHLPLLSQQHGTIENDHSAPSYYSQGSEIWSFGTVLASVGFVVSAPDYIGYGASKSYPHPYQHAASLAQASADMLRAAKEFAANEKIKLNGQLFLAGYSEGGFATMALHKKLETEMANEFTVTASAPGAGAYHTTAFAKYIIGSDKPLNFINTYLWVLQTYNREYKLNKPYSYFFNEPYATQLQKNGGSISSSVSPKRLFRESFQKAVKTGSDKEFMKALRDNDIYDWKPKAPVALFHGTSDDYVPFFNSQDAYKAMKARGAANVELHPVKGGDHFSSVASYSVGMLLFFAEFMEQPETAQP